MGMVHENCAIGGVSGISVDLSTREQQIFVKVPEEKLSRLLKWVKRPDNETSPFQLFFELSVWLEQVIEFYPSHFTNDTLRIILTAHIQENNNAIEANMIFNIKQCYEFWLVMKMVFDRVGPHVFKSKEIIEYLMPESI